MAIAAFIILAVLALVAPAAANLMGVTGSKTAQPQANNETMQRENGETAAEGGASGTETGSAGTQDATAGESAVSSGATSLARERVSGAANIDSAGADAWGAFDKTVTSMLFTAGKDPDAASVEVSDVTRSGTGASGAFAVRYARIDGTWHVFEFSGETGAVCTHHELVDKVAGVNANAEEAQADLPTDGVGEI